MESNFFGTEFSVYTDDYNCLLYSVDEILRLKNRSVNSEKAENSIDMNDASKISEAPADEGLQEDDHKHHGARNIVRYRYIEFNETL